MAALPLEWDEAQRSQLHHPHYSPMSQPLKSHYRQRAEWAPEFRQRIGGEQAALEGVEVTIGSEKLSGNGAQKTFVWTGAPENIDVSKNGDTLDSASGPWAVFRFVARAHHLTYNNLEWVIENNGQPVKLPNGKIKSYDFHLQVAGAANPFFDMPGLRCVGQVAGK